MGVALTADIVRALGPADAAGIVVSAGGMHTGALVKALGKDFVAALVIELGVSLNTVLVRAAHAHTGHKGRARSASMGQGEDLSNTPRAGPLHQQMQVASLGPVLLAELVAEMGPAFIATLTVSLGKDLSSIFFGTEPSIARGVDTLGQPEASERVSGHGKRE